MKKRKIILLEEKGIFTPEGVAKLQALYSRSAHSVLRQIKKILNDKDFAKFMAQYYVKYGHGSIGDCGTLTFFIENVSLLVAKAIQDSQLYSGQETSTRYINMLKQPIVDPIGSAVSKKILANWMKFYAEAEKPLIVYLKKQYPRTPGQKMKTYNNAIKARGFDIRRGFLPAGICTQLSWHTSLRQAAERIALLNYHPLAEVREVAAEMHKQLRKKYPSSFSHKLYPDQERFREETMAQYSYYHDPKSPSFSFKNGVDMTELKKYLKTFAARPKKTNLPVFLAELGNISCRFLLDFGSARDAQRHRNGIFRMPLLTTDIGFHEWYLNALPPELKSKAVDLLVEQSILLEKLDATPEQKQYYISLGFLVSCKTTYSLPQTLYVTELRSDKTVHETYRAVMHKMAKEVQKHFPGIALHADMDKNAWDIRRGTQTIDKRKAA